jgi:hypothetical protein
MLVNPMHMCQMSNAKLTEHQTPRTLSYHPVYREPMYQSLLSELWLVVWKEDEVIVALRNGVSLRTVETRE